MMKFALILILFSMTYQHVSGCTGGNGGGGLCWSSGYGGCNDNGCNSQGILFSNSN